MQTNGDSNGKHSLRKETIGNENHTAILTQEKQNGYTNGTGNGHLLLVPVPMEPERTQLRSPRTERTMVDVIEKADNEHDRKSGSSSDEPVDV